MEQQIHTKSTQHSPRNSHQNSPRNSHRNTWPVFAKESIDFHRKLEGKIKRLLSKNRSEIPTKFSPRHLQLLYGQQSEKKPLDSSIENILERIEPHCFDLDEKRIIEGKLLFFSIPEIIDPRHYKFSNISVLSIESSFDSESISIY